jgi:hypothetical protein
MSTRKILNETPIVAGNAILTIVEVKAAVEAFEHGEINVHQTLKAIAAACAAYEGAVPRRRKAA